MVKKKQDFNSSLGKSLIKARFQKTRSKTDEEKALQEVSEGFDDRHKIPVNKFNSITEQSDLAEFLATAELADTEFTAEKINSKSIVSTSATVTTVLTDQEEMERLAEIEDKRNSLRIPRRPKWQGLDKFQLDKLERESFLDWRRQMAMIQEYTSAQSMKNLANTSNNNAIAITPYERNIEIWRQLWRVVDKSDLLIQIVDARNPLLFYCQDLVQYCHEVSPSKQTLLLLNKADLLSDMQRSIWADYFKSLGMNFVFYSAAIASVEDAEEEAEEKTEELSKDNGQIMSRKELISLIKRFSRSHSIMAQPFTVGLTGYPNVGKSSTINSLLQEKKVTVGCTPGKTKHFQTLLLEPSLLLCDCPGLVFPNFAASKADLVLNGILPIDELRDFHSPTSLLTKRVPRFVLEGLYGIVLPKPGIDDYDQGRPCTASELLCTYAAMRGFMKAVQGNPDESRASRIILKDYVKGKLLFCHPPPGKDPLEFNSFNSYDLQQLLSSSKTESIIPINRLPDELKGRFQFDTDFFTDQNNIVARSNGKHSTSDFHRADSRKKLDAATASSKKHFKKKK